MGDHRRLAAIRLQKVYKSFRTRRQLADCAVLAEQKWWKVLDFAELKHISISFFDIEKPESAFSRWSRARTRAAKVGKGLSKDEKARKLALQHWLEAIDPRHRYGHNLQFYYVRWLHCESNQPFFYWLDIGDGKEVSVERCPRPRLQQQCIKYLDPAEREGYEVIVEDGKLIYKRSGKPVDTTLEPKGTKYIFVLSTTKTLYIGQKIKGNFQHSSFLAGGATLSAGRLEVEDGILTAVWPHSGHYLPTEENFQAFMSFLTENNVDITQVKKGPTDEEDEMGIKTAAFFTSQSKTYNQPGQGAQDGYRPRPQTSRLSELVSSNILKRSHVNRSKIFKLEIANKADVEEEEFKTPQQPPGSSPSEEPSTIIHDIEEEFSSEGYETAEDSLLSEDDFIYPKINIFESYEDYENNEPIPEEAILHRINSHKRTKSYQLGEQLQFRWTTGAGPRIGCMRDYPSQLQFEVLEHLQLSPRSDTGSPSCNYSSPTVRRETTLGKSPLCTD